MTRKQSTGPKAICFFFGISYSMEQEGGKDSMLQHGGIKCNCNILHAVKKWLWTKKIFFLLLFLPGPLTTAIVKLAATCVCENFAFKIFYIFSLDSAVGGKSAFIPKNKQLLLQNSDSVFLNCYYSYSSILCHSWDLFYT